MPRPVIVESKLAAPAPHPAVVFDRELLDRVLGAPPGSITVVAAAPGYGKTSLLATVASCAPGPLVWVSLDDHDADEGSFWSHLTAAMDRACPDFSRHGGRRLFGLDGASILPQLLNLLSACDEPVTIVIDDLHHVTDPSFYDRLVELVDHLPGSCRIIVSSRVELRLPQARWRAESRLVSVTLADLELSDDAAIESMRRRFDSVVDTALAKAATASTRGWPAGTFLTVSAFSDDASGRQQLLNADSAPPSVVSDYLESEVLNTLSPEARAMLLDLSIPDRLCGPLVDAILRRTDGAALLRQLSRDILFITTRDPAGTWFEFHPSLRESLRARLRGEDSDRAIELTDRAVDWLVSNGFHADACSTAVAQRIPELIDRVMIRQWAGIASEGLSSLIPTLLRAASAAGVEATPGFLAWSAYRRGIRGEFRDAARLLLDARTRQADGSEAALIHIVDANVLLRSGAVEEAFTKAMSMLCRPDLGDLDRIVAQWLAGRAAVLVDRADSAVPLLRATLDELRESNWTSQSRVRGDLAFALMEAGRHDEALEVAAAGLSYARRIRNDVVVDTSLQHLVRGVVADRNGEHETALEELRLALESPSPKVSLPHDAYIRLALAKALRRAGRDLAPARELVAEARALLEQCPDPGPVLLTAWTKNSRSLRLQRFSGVGMLDELTEREMALLRLLVSDLTRKELAKRLEVSPNTIKTHTAAIYRKLGVNSRAGAIQAAQDRQLL